MSRPLHVAVAHRSPHHPAHGGHSGGLPALAPDVVVTGEEHRLPYRLARLASRGTPYGYDSLSVQREWEAWRAGRGGASVHYVSAEHDARYLPRARRRGATSAWFHNPVPEVADLLDRRPGLRRLDRAWAVSEALVDVLAGRLGAERVGLLRYGVDTTAFRPGPAPGRDRPTVLTVGTHLRDWDQHRRVLPALRARVPDVEARVVGAASHAPALPSGPGVVVRHGVPDDELVAEYRAATVVFLPLRDATANSGLVEALACGCPIVATDVGGVAEYAAGAAVLVPPGDDEAAVEALAALLGDDGARAERGRAARARGEELDWARVTAPFRWPERG